MNEMNCKPLTSAQLAHLERLTIEVQTAQRTLNLFVAYLRAEHDAPPGDWQMVDARIGFERVEREGS